MFPRKVACGPALTPCCHVKPFKVTNSRKNPAPPSAGFFFGALRVREANALRDEGSDGRASYAKGTARNLHPLIQKRPGMCAIMTCDPEHSRSHRKHQRGCDGHHEMSDFGADGEPVHRGGESVAPVCPRTGNG